MSLNDSLGRSNGLVLPSFTKIEPTVSLSEVSGVSTANAAPEQKNGGLPKQEQSSLTDEAGESNASKIPPVKKAAIKIFQSTTTSGRGQLLNEESSDEEVASDSGKLDDELDYDGSSSGEDINDEKVAIVKAIANQERAFKEQAENDIISDTQIDDKDVEIEKEVANEVEKASVMATPVIAAPLAKSSALEPLSGVEQEDRNDVSLKRMRTGSIKDIPNPSLDLKKQKSFDFQTFLKDFKSKECEPVHKYLKSFLVQFSRRTWSVEEQIKLLRDFQLFLFNKLIEREPFNKIGDDELKVDNCKEGLEKLIMTRVYSQVFSPEISFLKLTDAHKQDRIQDRKYLFQLYLFEWIELAHLDVKINEQVDENFMNLATSEVQKINGYKSPRDKIICILNSSKVIFGLIRQQKTQENADAFVPLIIYVLLKAKVKNLPSNLQYIERFRNEDYLVGETSYYVSTLQIACNFIIGLNRDQLTITEEEYDTKIEQSRNKIKELQQKKSEESSPSEILSKSAGIMKQSISNTFNSILDSIDGINNGATDIRSEQDDSSELSNLERVKQLSIEEHNKEESVHKKQEKVLANLMGMFPNIDEEIIKDVMACCVNKEGVDIGECVNSLLALGE